jgi:hypothetical protein
MLKKVICQHLLIIPMKQSISGYGEQPVNTFNSRKYAVLLHEDRLGPNNTLSNSGEFRNIT